MSFDNQKISSNNIRLRTPDIDDDQVWIQSTGSETHRLQRGTREDFWFTAQDLVVISNRGGHRATLSIELLKSATEGIFIGSNRVGGFRMREGERKILRLKAGEVLSVRDLHMTVRETGIEVRPGQSVVF